MQSRREWEAKSGKRVRLWTWNISRWFVHVVGVWQASQLVPISPRCASLWQSAQAVPTWLNTSVRWQSRHETCAWADCRANPVVSWRNVGGLATGVHLSGMWHSAQSSVRSPWGCSFVLWP